MSSRNFALLFILLLATPAVLADEQIVPPLSTETDAEEGIQPGHSLHGAVFNRGPRQAAYLMEGMGDIDFPITTDNPLTQQFFNQGVGQLHGFWFFEAERSFRQAAKHDPGCAMAYWGMAMANVMNTKRYQEFSLEARKRMDQASEREQLYIRSLKNLRRLRRVFQRYPEELEAKAFLGIFPYYLAQNDKVPIRDREPADQLLKEVLARKPLHPAHHYVIHLWDTEEPDKALDSAAKVAHSAPGIAHMWHMAGHLYSLIHRNQEAAWYMEAALRLDHRYSIKDRVHPDIMHVYCHNAEWLARSLAQIGSVDAAIARSEDLIELPRHPTYNDLKPETSSRYGHLRLTEILAQFELWDELIRYCQSPGFLEPGSFESQVEAHKLLAIASARNGNINEAGEERQRLADLLSEQENHLNGMKDSAEIPNVLARIDTLGEAIGKVDGHLSVAEKHRVWSTLSVGVLAGIAIAALLLVAAAFMFERRVHRILYLLVVVAGGGFLGYWLTGPASDIYSLDPMYRARDLLSYGRSGAAVKAARAHVEEHPQEVQPLADLIYVLWETGDQSAAREEFDALREISSGIDIDKPCFERLKPIAAEFGYPEDWRIEKPMPAEHGDLPALESLGPLRWQPSPADEWTLPDTNNKPVSLAELKGKPLVLVFYLGYGCLHCAEQLQEFAEQAEKFEKAGLTVVAISSDEQPLLKKSLENYKGGDFPFTLLADPKLEVFKQYRCYDDFENLTLHGTFLIDPDGLIRWQDISYEPFMDADFVIDESKRLLAQPVREE